MKVRVTIFCAAFVTLLTAHRSAQAGYVVTLEQVGPNVVATGSGTLDPNPIPFFENISTATAFTVPEDAAVMRIGSSGNAAVYGFSVMGSPMTGPSSFGTSAAIHNADSSSGDFVGIDGGDGNLYVPTAYVSGSPLADTATWNNQTFSSLGVTPGIYEWTWGNGADQNYTLEIGAVPEPATWGVGALLALGLFLHFKQRRRSA